MGPVKIEDGAFDMGSDVPEKAQGEEKAQVK